MPKTKTIKSEKKNLTIKLDCSYGIRRFGKDGNIEEFKRNFKKGENLDINKDLEVPFKANEISAEMADMLIYNKQGG